METVVSLEEGRVRFFSEKEPQHPVEMSAGTLSRWNTQMDEPADPKPVEFADISGWRNNMLIFNEQSLSIIFRELERRFDIHIQFEGDVGEMDILTAYYSPPLKPDSIIEDICMVKNLKYSKDSQWLPDLQIANREPLLSDLSESYFCSWFSPFPAKHSHKAMSRIVTLLTSGVKASKRYSTRSQKIQNPISSMTQNSLMELIFINKLMIYPFHFF